ncbi:MAG: hypothetical protein NZ839_03435 [Endomicrobia bacterium]|nr:hypothetical protein [Endomicrobiia bacterium]
MKTCVSYFGNKIYDHVKVDFQDIKEHNFDSVVITFSEEDMQYYSKNFIKITKIAQELGLQVYLDPWGVCRIFAGEAYSNFTNLYPETKQVLQSGKQAPASCPNNPKVVEFFYQWIDTALECNPDGIFWDEPHFYLDWEGIGDNTLACFCDVCQQKFYSKYRRLLKKNNIQIKDNISEKVIKLYEVDEEVQQFRYDSMTEFLSNLTKYVKQKRPQIKNIICFLSTMNERAGTNWEDITSIPEVDIISTSAYYLLGNREISYVTETAKRLLSTAQKYNKPSLLWFQLFGVPKEKNEELRIAIDLAKKAGVENFAVWGYKACKYMSHFPTGDPDALWEIVKDEFSKII